METNFTPLDLNRLEKKENDINNILLIIVTITAFIVAVLLFVLIQKKINEKPESVILPTPTVNISPTPIKVESLEDLTPTASPSPLIEEEISSPSSEMELGDNQVKEGTSSPEITP